MFATDPSGTNYAQWQKDARLVTSSEGHASDANTWIRRNCIKYDSGYWWINISGADDPNNTTTARWSSDSTIADAFAALYQGENWLGLPTLTSMSDNVEAFSKYTEAINVTYDFGGITDNGLWAHNDTTSDWQISKTLVRVNYQNDEKAAREINGFRIFPAPDSFGGLDGRVKYFLNNEGTSISVIIDSTAAESTLNTNTLPGVKISVFGRLKA